MATGTVGLSGLRLRRRRALGALRALVGGVVLVAMPGAAPAAEPEKGADRAICAESYRSAQVQRRSGSLRRARESLLLCVSDRCPAFIQPDCLRWLTEVEAAMPTVTFAAKGVDGKDVTDVRVVLDGQVLRESLDGKSIAVDPGAHTLHFEHGTEPAVDQQLVVREGEKARVITVSWLAAPRESGEDRAARTVSSGPSTAAWIFGGVGVASLATFGILAFHGMQRRSDLEKECFGSCTRGQIDSVKSELTAADIALGVGIVSVGVATVLFLTNRSSEKATSSSSSSSVSVGVAPHKTGAALGLSGRF